MSPDPTGLVPVFDLIARGMAMPQIDYDSIAAIYDLYVTADYDVPFFLSETAKTNGPILELMAGTGRLSIPIAATGVSLTCVDSSRAMLDVLSRKLEARGLEADIHCADVRRLNLPARFELAILPFQSFMEIIDEGDQRAALRAVFDRLDPGGRFICTLHNPAVRRSQVDGSLRLVGSFPHENGTLVVSGFEHGGRPIVKRLQFFEFFADDGRLQRKQVLAMEFAFIERQAFQTMAQQAGFQSAQLYGNYDRTPFDPEISPVMIWVLTKEKA
jgi:SAM-dependent methyltransferase